MNVYIKNNTFWFEVENLTRLFFPNEKISVFKEFSAVQAPYIYTELGDTITVRVKIGDFLRESHAAASPHFGGIQRCGAALGSADRRAPHQAFAQA